MEFFDHTTTQQIREFLAFDHPYRFVIHDRDSIFSPALDQALRDFGVRPIRTPVRVAKAPVLAGLHHEYWLEKDAA